MRNDIGFNVVSGQSHSRRRLTIPIVINKMTTVLISVARLEFMPLTPSLPRMAVKPAKNADPNENNAQGGRTFISSPWARDGPAQLLAATRMRRRPFANEAVFVREPREWQRPRFLDSPLCVETARTSTPRLRRCVAGESPDYF